MLKVVYFFYFSAEPSIRLIETTDEILDYHVEEVGPLGDELFMLRERYDGSAFLMIYPHDRPIPLTPEIPSMEKRRHIATCNKMQCLYLTTVNYQTQKFSIWKITKDNDGTFLSSLWIQKDEETYMHRPLNVSVDGNVLLSWYSSDIDHRIAMIYNSSGILIRQVMEPFDPFTDRRLQKSDGRIVFICGESRTEVQNRSGNRSK